MGFRYSRKIIKLFVLIILIYQRTAYAYRHIPAKYGAKVLLFF